MDENEKVEGESREMMEELCGPSAAAVASAAEDESAANAAAPVDPCVACKEQQANALLSELALRHQAEDRVRDLIDAALRDQAAREAAEAERDAAIVERDARIADEALRAQRVDVEALRAKVEAMRKNLMAVDARADERHVAALRARDVECEAQVAAVRAEEQAAAAQLAGLRAGDAARVEAIQEAMGAIWAFDRRDRAAATARTEGELRRQLTQILSVAFVLPQ